MRSMPLGKSCLGICLVFIFIFPFSAGAKGFSPITVESSPPGAQVFVNDTIYGKTPVNFNLANGKYILKVKKRGYQPYQKKIKVGHKKPQRISVQLNVKGRKGKLKIESTPKGAEVFINDKSYGTTPVSLELADGKYSLKLKKKGYGSHQEKIMVGNRKVQNIKVKLVKVKQYGKLQIDSTPAGAKLFIDGVFIQNTPATRSLEVGKHNIRLEKAGFKKAHDSIVIRNKERLRLSLKLVEKQKFSDLVIKSRPSAARIYINDHYYDLTPARIELRQGKYRITVEKDDYHSGVKQVVVHTDRDAHIFFDMKPVKKHGSVEISSLPPECLVFIDDQFYSKTPTTARLLGGEHTIILKKRGWQTHVDKIAIRGGENIHRQYRLHENVVQHLPTATLRLHSTPQGAGVMINGIFHGNTPLDIHLHSGIYQLEVDAEGFKKHEQQIEIGRGELRPVWVQLEEIEPLVRYGQLNITSDKRAKVLIDGEYRGETPLLVRLSEGDHHLQLKRKQYRTFNEIVPIDAWREHEVDVTLEWMGAHPYEERVPMIEIISQPLGAKIFINNQYYGRTPQTLELLPGDYSLEIWHKGYHPFAQQLYVEAGQNPSVRAHLRWKGHEHPAFLLHEIIKDVMEIN